MSIVGIVAGFVSLFFVGLLAGEEFVVRFAVRGPLAALDERPHLQLRQSLIRSLRVLVPATFLPALVSAVAVTIIDGAGTGIGFRCAGLAALFGWTLVTFLGTVPINAAALGWQPDAPPSDWRTLVGRWERLDTVRTVAAGLAFALFLAAMALRLAAH